MSSKAREALLKASVALSWATHGHLTEDDAKECLEIVETAIAEPLRNCDVGTAEEQYARFKKWCEGELYKRPMNTLTGEPCKSCPCYSVSVNGVDGCNDLRWAQMPYESEVGK